MDTAIGLGIGVIIGQNWNRIKKGLIWLGDRINEELSALDVFIGEDGKEYYYEEYQHLGWGYIVPCGKPIPVENSKWRYLKPHQKRMLPIWMQPRK
ncbi:MAG: hypothetical protein F6K14_00585 [Symploca sp. SIO2C1]|nr:hypothetical protein [Symploca sp. SIO2C1]